MTDPAGDEPHEHLAGLGVGEVDLLHDERGSELLKYRGAHSHARDPNLRDMWVLFDLNGTLVDPSVVAGEIAVAALDEANMMAMVTVIAGADATFRPLLEAALRRGLERAGP